MYHTPVEASYIMRQLVSVDKKDVWNIEHSMNLMCNCR